MSASLKDINSEQPTLGKEDIVVWFEDFITTIKVDQLAMERGVASPEKSNFYTSAMQGDIMEMSKSVRNLTNKYLISKVTFAFLEELRERKALPNQIGFGLSPSTILVWAEINDDDEQKHDQILLAEAKINAEFKENNFSLDTMIVETSDNIRVPNHYVTLKEIYK